MILHLAYRLDYKEWKCDTEHQKILARIRKGIIQERFRDETGLLIDYVKQGFGNTNDGNNARRFFRDPVKAAEITKVDVNLIIKVGAISEVVFKQP